MAEAATLAHVMRPLALARALDPHEFEIHFACAACFAPFLQDTGFSYRPLPSLASEVFLQRLAAGSPLYRYAELQQYLTDDLALLDQVQPAAVVGDFRLSLSIAAPLRKVRYLNVTNAHWSPFRTAQGFPLPEHVLGRALGPKLGQVIFNLVQPAAFAWHARALNRLRHKYHLPPLGSLTHAYTHGDEVLYCDIPELAPVRNAPATYHYLGIVSAAPTQQLPSWAGDIPQDRSSIYVNFGSSGNSGLLPALLTGLADHQGGIMAATAGRTSLPPQPPHIHVEKYLPGDWAAAHSAVVVCNGGSAPVYQALQQGAPVIGIASNMDQYLMMNAVERAGAGILLRAGRTTAAQIRQAIRTVCGDPKYQAVADTLANAARRYQPGTILRAILNSTTAISSAANNADQWREASNPAPKVA